VRPATRVIAALATLVPVLLLTGCNGNVTPEVVPGIDACNECGMVIDQPGQACGYFSDGEFVTFDSPACLLRSYEALRKTGTEPLPGVHVADYVSAAMHPAETSAFLLTDHRPTVMNGGVLCFADRAAAEAQRKHEDEVVTDWAGFRTARGEPDRVLEVSFGPTGMVPEIVEAAKGELVLWRAQGSGLERDLVIAVKGYPEVGSVVLPASGEPVVFRLRAERPGAGFPVVGDEGKPLGMLKVSGAHTADEEAL
jgi:hypothetical protein